MPLIDLHAHYPMHTRFPPRVGSGVSTEGKKLEFWAANVFLNYAAGRPRVDLTEFEAGSPGGAGSVLYDPDDEFLRDAKPRPQAFPNLIAQMDNVEKEIRLLLRRGPARQEPGGCDSIPRKRTAVPVPLYRGGLRVWR
jgi:hypothetical protein